MGSGCYGRVIVEHEQDNNDRAKYGENTLKQLSKALTKEFGRGFSVSNLQFMRRFYQVYQIQQTLSVKLSWSHYCELLIISDDDRRSFYEKRMCAFRLVCKRIKKTDFYIAL